MAIIFWWILKDVVKIYFGNFYRKVSPERPTELDMTSVSQGMMSFVLKNSLDDLLLCCCVFVLCCVVACCCLLLVNVFLVDTLGSTASETVGRLAQSLPARTSTVCICYY